MNPNPSVRQGAQNPAPVANGGDAGTKLSSAPATAPQAVTLAQSLTDLQKAIADPEATDKQLLDLLKVVRSARQKAKADFDAAQQELLLVLTPDQQVVLTNMGLIN